MKYLLVLSLIFLCGCEKYYLSIKKEYIDQTSLASTFVGSPDPLQKHPPHGEQLLIQWNLPSKAVQEQLILVLNVLYKDYSTKKILYPVDRRRGAIFFPIINEQFKETGGLLTYKAEITNLDGKVLESWKQQIWTNLITTPE